MTPMQPEVCADRTSAGSIAFRQVRSARPRRSQLQIPCKKVFWNASLDPCVSPKRIHGRREAINCHLSHARVDNCRSADSCSRIGAAMRAMTFEFVFLSLSFTLAGQPSQTCTSQNIRGFPIEGFYRWPDQFALSRTAPQPLSISKQRRRVSSSAALQHDARQAIIRRHHPSSGAIRLG